MESLKKPEPVFSVPLLAARLRDALHVPPNAVLTVALSGGLDSTVLLHALTALRQDYPFILKAIHVDHGLHPGSAAWADHCAHLCRSLDVPLQVQHVQVDRHSGEGLEAAARRARYAAFAELLPTDALLVTAHHADDQAETVLLNLLRGAGVAGLAAMRGQRRAGPFQLLRPLLEVPRAALAAYAQAHHLAWVEDPSNRDTELRRNFLRTEILPRLELRWPDAAGSLTRVAGHFAEAQELLDELAQQDLQICTTNQTRLSVPAMLALSPPRRRNLLRYWLRAQEFHAPDARKLEEVLGLLTQTTHSRHACVHYGRADVWRYRDYLAVVPAAIVPAALDATWDPRVPIEIEGVGRLHSQSTEGQGLALAALAHAPLRIRLRRGGERLQLAGRAHHHALKKLLQESGVPPWERARLPLLFLDNQLAAVADRWVSRDFAAGQREPGLRIVWTPFPKPEIHR